MDIFYDYLLKPLQKKIFGDFGYYDYNTQILKVDVDYVNSILNGGHHLSGPEGGEVSNECGKSHGSAAAGVLGSSFTPFRLVKAEIKSSGMLSFFRRLTGGLLKVEYVDMVWDYVPAAGVFSPPEASKNSVNAQSHPGRSIPSHTKGGNAFDFLEKQFQTLFSSMSPEEYKNQARVDLSSRSANDFSKAHVDEQSKAKTIEKGFRSVEDIMEYMSLQMQGSCISLEKIHLVVRFPPILGDEGYRNENMRRQSGDTRRSPETKDNPDSSLQEGTLLVYIQCKGGLVAKIDKTDVFKEAFEASLRMGDCRVFMRVVGSSNQGEPHFTKEFASHWKWFGLEDLFITSYTTERCSENQSKDEPRGRPNYAHTIRVSYSALARASNPARLGDSTPSVTSSHFPPAHDTLRSAPENSYRLHVEVETSHWSSVCTPAKLSTLVQHLSAYTKALQASSLPRHQSDDIDQTHSQPTFCKVRSSRPGAPVRMPCTTTQLPVTRCARSLTWQLRLMCCSMSTSFLTVESSIEVKSAWRLAFQTSTATRLATTPVYNCISCAHFTFVARGVDVTLPSLATAHTSAFFASPAGTRPSLMPDEVSCFNASPGKDGSMDGKKSRILHNIFHRNNLVNSKVTDLLDKHGGYTVFIGVHSIQALEHRPRSEPRTGSPKQSPIFVPNTILQTERMPYAFVCIFRTTMPIYCTSSPADAWAAASDVCEVHTEVVSLFLAKITTNIDMELFETLGRYVALLRPVCKEDFQEQSCTPPSGGATNCNAMHEPHPAGTSTYPSVSFSQTRASFPSNDYPQSVKIHQEVRPAQSSLRRQNYTGKLLLKQLEVCVRFPLNANSPTRLLDTKSGSAHCLPNHDNSMSGSGSNTNVDVPHASHDAPQLSKGESSNNSILQELLEHLSNKSREYYRSIAARGGMGSPSAADAWHASSTRTKPANLDPLCELLSIGDPSQVCFLSDMLYCRIQDFQAELTSNSKILIQWKEGVLSIEDPVADWHNSTPPSVGGAPLADKDSAAYPTSRVELLRVNYSQDMNFTISFARLLGESSDIYILKAPHSSGKRAEESPDGAKAALTPTFSPTKRFSALPQLLSLHLCLPEVETQPLSQDDYLLATYFLIHLHSRMKRFWEAVERAGVRRTRNQSKTKPRSPLTQSISCSRSILQAHTVSSCPSLTASQDTTTPQKGKLLGQSYPKGLPAQSSSPKCEDNDCSPGLRFSCFPHCGCCVWEGVRGSFIDVKLQIQRIRVRLQAPRLSILSMPLTEPLRRRIPPRFEDSVDFNMLYHQYLLELRELSVLYRSCGAPRTGSVSGASIRVGSFSLSENILPLPYREQSSLVGQTSIAQSLPNASHHCRDTNRQDEERIFSTDADDGVEEFPFCDTLCLTCLAVKDFISLKHQLCAGELPVDNNSGSGRHFVCSLRFRCFSSPFEEGLEEVEVEPRPTRKLLPLRRSCVTGGVGGICIRHLPAHLGDSWISVLTNYFSSKASQPTDKDCGNVSSNIYGNPSHRSVAGYGGELRYRNNAPSATSSRTRVSLEVAQVMWVYRPQGKTRPMAVFLAPDMRFSANLPLFSSTGVRIIQGWILESGSVYVSTNSKQDGLQENVWGCSRKGSRIDLENAGFVRLLSFHNSLDDAGLQHRDAGSECSAQVYERPPLRENPTTTPWERDIKNDPKSRSLGRSRSNLAVLWNPLPHPEKAIVIRLHHLHGFGFMTKDCVHALLDITSCFVNMQDLAYVEKPQVLVLRSSPFLSFLDHTSMKPQDQMQDRANYHVSSSACSPQTNTADMSAIAAEEQYARRQPRQRRCEISSALSSSASEPRTKQGGCEDLLSLYQSHVSRLLKQTWFVFSSDERAEPVSKKVESISGLLWSGVEEKDIPRSNDFETNLISCAPICNPIQISTPLSPPLPSSSYSLLSSSSFTSITDDLDHEVVLPWSIYDAREKLPVCSVTATPGHCTASDDLPSSVGPIFDLEVACMQAPHYMTSLSRPRSLASMTVGAADLGCLEGRQDSTKDERRTFDLQSSTFHASGPDDPTFTPSPAPNLFMRPINMELYVCDCSLDLSLYESHELASAIPHQRARDGNKSSLPTLGTTATPWDRFVREPGSIDGERARLRVPDSRHGLLSPVRSEEQWLNRLFHEGLRRGFGTGGKGTRIVLSLRGVTLQLDTFASVGEEQKWIYLIVQKANVYDCIHDSKRHMLLTGTPSTPGNWPRTKHFLEITWLTILPGNLLPRLGTCSTEIVGPVSEPEEEVAMWLHPLLLTWSGPSLDFFLRLFDLDSKTEPNNSLAEVERGVRANVGPCALRNTESPCDWQLPPPLHFRVFVIHPSTILLSGSFESKKGFLSALMEGKGLNILRNIPILSRMCVDNFALEIPLIVVETCKADELLCHILDQSNCFNRDFLFSLCYSIFQPPTIVTKIGDALRNLFHPSHSSSVKDGPVSVYAPMQALMTHAAQPSSPLTHGVPQTTPQLLATLSRPHHVSPTNNEPFSAPK